MDEHLPAGLLFWESSPAAGFSSLPGAISGCVRGEAEYKGEVKTFLETALFQSVAGIVRVHNFFSKRY